MPHLKLHYFGYRGRGEACRILLTLAGADWEDVGVDRSHEWVPALQQKYPYGKLPVLEVDGKMIAQTMAVLSYIAREHGFVPPKHIEASIADSIVLQIHDCVYKAIEVYMEKDPAKKEELDKNLKENILNDLKRFEKIQKENSGGKCFFFGEKITYADVCFFDLWNNFLGKEGALVVPDILKEKFPSLARLYRGVMDNPIIFDYLKKRPLTKI